MNKIKYLLISVLLIVIVIFAATPNIYAKEKKAKSEETESTGSFGVDLGDLSKYKEDDIKIGSLQDKANGIIGLITTIGVVVSVVALIAIGIKYMLGSVEEKAEYKETLKPYSIGAFLVFTVSLVPQLIYQFMQNLN